MSFAKRLVDRNFSKRDKISLPPELVLASQVYESIGMVMTVLPQREFEGIKYGACRFAIDGRRIVFRVAKITPTKIGQFVTIWNVSVGGIEPLAVEDEIDFVVINVADKKYNGQFIFNQEILIEQGIFSRSSWGGKLAMRVYPPWTTPIAKQALETQQWQSKFFVALNLFKLADAVKLKQLLQ